MAELSQREVLKTLAQGLPPRPEGYDPTARPFRRLPSRDCL